MALLGSLTVGILGNMDNLSNTFTNAQREVQKFAKKTQALGKSISSVGDTLTRRLTMPAVAAAGALTSITLVKGFNRLVGIDTAQAKLKGLGHDAKSVEEIMNSALESVRGTAFGMDEAATTAANAVAAGIEPGKELTRYLSLTGDAAAIANASMSEMGSIINKVTTAGKAYNGELQQLSDRGLPIYQWIAEEANTTADAVFDMASKGEISTEMFLSAIENNIGGAAKIMGEESFSAAIANIGADISRIGANFLDAGGKGEGFFSTVKPLITEFRGFLQSLEPLAADLGVKFGQAFTNFIDKIIEIKNWFTSLSEDTQKLILRIAGIGSAVAVGIGPALKIVGGLITGFGTITKIVGLLMGPVGIAIAVIGALVAAGVLLYKNWDTIKSKAIDVFGAFSPLIDTVKASFQTLMSFLEPIWESLKTLFQSLLPILEKLGVVVGAVLVTAFGVLIGVFNGVVAAIGPVINAIINFVDYIVNMVNFVVALLTGDFAGAWQYLQDAGKSTVDFFINLFTGLVNFVKGFVDGIIGFFKGLYMTLVGNSIIPDMVNAIIQWFKNLWNWLIGIVSGLVKSAIGFFVDLKNNIQNRITEAKNAVINRFTEIVSGVRNKASEIVSTVRSKFNEAKDKITEPIQKAKETISKIVEDIKGFFSKMKLKLPKIELPKLPKFSLEGKFSLTPPSVPKLKVNWNALGGIFTRPTIFNTANAGLQGVGEAGAEAIIPLKRSVLSGIGEGIANTINKNDEALLSATLEQNKILKQLLKKDTNIVVNDRILGRELEPVITELQERKNNIVSRFRG